MYEPPPDLVRRLGADRVQKRLRQEQISWNHRVRRDLIGLWDPVVVPWIVRTGLRMVGLGGRTYREFLDLEIVENPVVLPNLPPAFEGFRLLQLTDLHSDIDPALIDHVIEKLKRISFDHCVLTGDYHNRIGVPWDDSVAFTLRLKPYLGTDPLAILGNHDFLAKVPAFESAGLRVLLNESVPLQRDGQQLWICGVDDPHLFQTHDLERASAGIPEGACRILLSHSPETWQEAAALGYALHLSGHTHGGQICLPGGFALVCKAPVPRPLIAGPWREGTMVGYTSRGTGSCGVAARLNCRPEITIHILKSA